MIGNLIDRNLIDTTLKVDGVKAIKILQEMNYEPDDCFDAVVCAVNIIQQACDRMGIERLNQQDAIHVTYLLEDAYEKVTAAWL